MIKFAPYVFQEYPKALYHPIDKAMTIVKDKSEEDAVIASWDKQKKPGRPRKSNDNRS